MFIQRKACVEATQTAIGVQQAQLDTYTNGKRPKLVILTEKNLEQDANSN
jgi:hypothetical protein